MVMTQKKEPWFLTKIRSLEEKLERFERNEEDTEDTNKQDANGQDTNGAQKVHIDSYCKGFYDCMSKYAIFAKGARRRIVETIRQRYKGDGNTQYVWRVK